MAKFPKRKIGLALGSGAARGLAHIGAGDFHRAQECILRGEWVAQSSPPEIKRLLEA